MKGLLTWISDISPVLALAGSAIVIVKMLINFFEKRRNSIPIATQVQQNTRDIKSNSEKIATITKMVEEQNSQRELLLLEFKKVELSNKEMVTSFNQLIVFFIQKLEGGEKELTTLMVQGLGIKNGKK